MISGKSIYYKTWLNKGIFSVCNLIGTQGQLLCFEDFSVNLVFTVIFSITLVFLVQFLNFGRAKS